MTQDTIRHYVVLKASREVIREYFNKDGRAESWATSYIAKHVYGSSMAKPPFDAVSLPSNDVYLGVERPRETPMLQKVVVALDAFSRDKFRSTEVINDIMKAAIEKGDIFAGSSTDLPFAAADHWCGEGADPIFSDRSAAERLLGIDYLRQQSCATGKGVNVVVVDQGLDKQALGKSYGDGWTVGNSLPGSARPQPGSLRRSHGMMIAQNILKVAPEATLFDLPLAPPKISNIQAFLSLAHAAYGTVLTDIANWKLGKFPGPWILVNPWGIYDRRSEYPRGHYTENPNSIFNKLVADAVRDKIDVVFAAGNCGQFCPDGRCGKNDRGPGHSIWGANSLDQVLTTGAVRSDSMWLGYSSQGPGQPALGSKKPDLCATSQFCEDDDAFTVNTGTSAACGLTGGIVAALRSCWDSTAVSPSQLKDVLNRKARKPPGLRWKSSLGYRLGNGILDARAAFDELRLQFPPPARPRIRRK